MRQRDVEKLLEIGTALSAEKDYDKLLERILADVMSIAHCDAGTLYLKAEDLLEFKILRNDTMKSYQGGCGEKVNLPPVPISRENVCSLALLLKKTINIENVRNCSEYDLAGPLRYDAMTGYRTVSMLVVPMNRRNGEVIGILQLINAQKEDGTVIAFARDLEQMAQCVAGQAAVAIDNMRYVEEIRTMFSSFVQVMASAIDERTPYNATHTRNMVRYGSAFIDFLDQRPKTGDGDIFFASKQREELLMSVWLHDLGKLVTPLQVMNKATRLEGRKELIMMRFDLIFQGIRIRFLSGELDGEGNRRELEAVEHARELVEKADTAGFINDAMMEELKALGGKTYTALNGDKQSWLAGPELECLMVRKGTLTEDERKVMENHVVVTEKLLRQIRFPEDYEHVTGWASGHHEYLDGSGYPRHLKGDELPIEVRIITILDIFDALTASDRPYKPGMPVERALKILGEMAEKEGKLDPRLTELFIKSHCWEKGDINEKQDVFMAAGSLPDLFSGRDDRAGIGEGRGNHDAACVHGGHGGGGEPKR